MHFESGTRRISPLNRNLGGDERPPCSSPLCGEGVASTQGWKRPGGCQGLGLGLGLVLRADQVEASWVTALVTSRVHPTPAQLPVPPLPDLALGDTGRPSSPSLSELQPLTSVISSSESLSSFPASVASGPPAPGSARRGATASPEGRSGPRPSPVAASRGAAVGPPPGPAAGRWPREPRGLG